MTFDDKYKLNKVGVERPIGTNTIFKASEEAECVICKNKTHWRNTTDGKPVCGAGCLHYHVKGLIPMTVNDLIIRLQALVEIDPEYGKKASYIYKEGEDSSLITGWPPQYD